MDCSITSQGNSSHSNSGCIEEGPEIVEKKKRKVEEDLEDSSCLEASTSSATSKLRSTKMSRFTGGPGQQGLPPEAYHPHQYPYPISYVPYGYVGPYGYVHSIC
jgi:hypothetical protein